jgi:hypothetical protein
MTDIELLDWQFRIAKMGRDELAAVLELMEDTESKPFSLHDRDAVDRLKRAALIANTEAMLNRASSAGSGGRKGKPKRTATVDLGAYYDALNVQDAEAHERADRTEVRAMAERRLAHMDARDGFEYNPTPSPLQSYMQER